MRKDARLIAMELRNWLNKKEYTLEELNRAVVVLRNGLLGSKANGVAGKGSGESGRGIARGKDRSPNLGAVVASAAKRSVFIEDQESCLS